MIRRAFRVFAVGLGLLVGSALLGWVWAPLDSLAIVQPYLAATLLLIALLPWLSGLRVVLLAIALFGVGDIFWPHGVAAPDAGLRHLQHNLHQGNRAADLPDRLAGKDTATLQEVGEAIFTLADLPAEWHLEICPRPGWVTTAALTRHPVVASGCTPSGAAWIRLRLPDGVGSTGPELTLVSVHLFWPWPAGGTRQARQVAGLAAELSALPRPVLMGGDFNQMPWSAAVRTLANSIGAEVSPGLRATFVKKDGLVRLPIDHILVPRGWRSEVTVGLPYRSDHRSLTARIAPPPPGEERRSAR